MLQKHRRQLLINPSFQIQFILKFCIVVVVAAFLIGIAVFFLTGNSTTVAIENTRVFAKPTSDFILPSLSVTVLIVSVFAALVIFCLSLLATHKIVGPIYRLQKEISLMQEGDIGRSFKIRDKDELQELAKSLNFMASTFRGKHEALRNSYQALTQYLEEKNFAISSDDKAEVKRLLSEMNDSLKYFRT